MHDAIKIIRNTIEKNVKGKKTFTPTEINMLMPWVLVAMGLIELEEFEIEEDESEQEESAFSHIEDELDGAEEYLKMYNDTKDMDFLEMSKDEVKHAKKFLMDAKEKTTMTEDKKELEKLTERYNNILQKHSKIA